ncbi:MAG: enoyl-CoA hydratase/isomerase family protein [Deltaproteobacteria bacterium]|nr:enoyl-CoA hydratase/isomerase family protein [Deltaproteobacteria bacterium]
MTSGRLLAITTQDGVRLVRLAREEKRNALSIAMRDELEACFTDAERDASVAVVVLTGGERVFCAGFDLEEVVATRFEAFRHRVREFNRAVFGFTKPLVVAVSGAAMAGGFDLALAGDFLLASETARFAHPEVNFGAAPTLAPLWTRIGLARATDLVMRGRTVEASEALAIGLIDRLVPAARLIDEAMELARELAAKPPQTLQAVKAAARRIATLDRLEGIQFEAENAARALFDPANVSRAAGYFRSLGEKK